MTQMMTVMMRMLNKVQLLSDFSTSEEHSAHGKQHLWTFVDTLLTF